ncbi:uncharacterized protein LOC119357581 [Triticum dicoccoides]|uniref:uncharacterized protein LOC119357581 n=1 Tax=Triticum dicoccoides TaxID=85692 RepID=UPI00188ED814|nr:uncharacterized protein LOC119357581 [Triticum dicoccoides]XP_044460136.1 uncharacterized protein LOC123191486 [Triticum aestivum]
MGARGPCYIYPGFASSTFPSIPPSFTRSGSAHASLALTGLPSLAPSSIHARRSRRRRLSPPHPRRRRYGQGCEGQGSRHQGQAETGGGVYKTRPCQKPLFEAATTLGHSKSVCDAYKAKMEKEAAKKAKKSASSK